jgi:predicted Zn-dependent protease with MMP-like domain
MAKDHALPYCPHGSQRVTPVLTFNHAQFERIVEKTLEELPERFHALLENLAIVVEEEPDPDELRELGLDPEEDELFGVYQGVSLLERGAGHSGLPDRIVIYRGPLLRCFRTRADLAEEIRRTVIHELGHHMGLSDDQMVF